MSVTILRRSGITVAIAGLVTISGCGGSEDKPSVGSVSGYERVTAPASGVVTEDTVARCAGFSTADAAEILGVAAADVTDESSDIHKTSRSCAYATSGGPSRSVFFSLTREATVEEAARSYASMKETLPLAASVQKAAGAESKDSALIEIFGLGDEALWSNVNGSLAARDRNVTILVMSPDDRPTQAKVAQKVVALLRK